MTLVYYEVVKGLTPEKTQQPLNWKGSMTAVSGAESRPLEFLLFTLMGDIPLSWWPNKPTQSVKALLANANGQVVEALRIGKTRLKTTHVVGRVFVGVNATPIHTLFLEEGI